MRLFRTRSQATAACRAGKVRMDGQIIKPSREARPGDEINISFHPVIRTVRVLGLPQKRVGAPLVPQYMEDLTPDSEYLKLKMVKEVNFEFREPGSGRPTKRQRREIGLLKKFLGE